MDIHRGGVPVRQREHRVQMPLEVAVDAAGIKVTRDIGAQPHGLIYQFQRAGTDQQAAFGVHVGMAADMELLCPTESAT